MKSEITPQEYALLSEDEKGLYGEIYYRDQFGDYWKDYRLKQPSLKETMKSEITLQEYSQLSPEDKVRYTVYCTDLSSAEWLSGEKPFVYRLIQEVPVKEVLDLSKLEAEVNAFIDNTTEDDYKKIFTEMDALKEVETAGTFLSQISKMVSPHTFKLIKEQFETRQSSDTISRANVLEVLEGWINNSTDKGSDYELGFHYALELAISKVKEL